MPHRLYIDVLRDHLLLSFTCLCIGCRDLGLPTNSSEISTKIGSKRKKKRKEERFKRKSAEADGNSCSCATSEVEIQQDELKTDNSVTTVCKGKQETA